MTGFIFGSKGLPKTPKEVARLRAVAAAMQPKRAPRDVGEGIYALGSGLASGLTALHANRQEQKGQEGAANAFQSIVSAMNGGGGGSSAPSTQFSYSGSIPASETETDPVNRRIDQGFAAFGNQDDVGKRLMGDLMGDFSLSKEQAAGVVGNLAHESGGFESLQEIKPLVPGSRGGYGYAQWTGPRRRAYEAYAKENQLDPSSYEANYGFLKHELQNTPEGRVLNGLKNAQTAGEAAEMFSKGFLRPGIPHMDSRIQRANEYQTASLGPAVGPEQPAADPKAVLAQRLMAARGQSLPESQPPAAQQAQAMQGGNVQQQPSQSTQRVAQAVQGMDQQTIQIIDALNNPYMSQGQKAVLGAMLDQRMQSSDPMRQMQLEKAQLELEQMRDPKPEYSTLSAEQVQSLGLPEGVYQRGPKGKISQVGGSGVSVNIGEGDKFYENLDKKNAETFAMLSEGGVTARGKLNQIDRLEGLLAQAPSGMEAGVKQMLGDFGIKSEGLDTIQSTRALLEAMVPQQRPVGSGPMSDADVKMFRNSLPRLINQPGGNELILETMRGIAQYEAQMGEIADMVADRSLTPSEGRKRIRELENPISAFRNTLKDGGADAPKGQQKQPPLAQRGSASGVGGDFMTRLPNMTREDLQGLDRSKMSFEELKAAAERYRMLVGGEI